MKKQFFRVKQLADQTFLRADKSEGLNHEELQMADQRVEYLRGALTAISKKLPPVGVPQIENVEKRMKKYPEYQLGMTLIEQAVRKRNGEIAEHQGNIEEETCKLFQHILKECGHVEQDLAKEQAEHESKVEQLVSSPLLPILETELPNIAKLKKNLNRHVLDKDSFSNRYHQAASKNGNQKDSLKEEMEDAELKVEQTRDALASEMFGFLRKENELSQYMLQILKLQRGYHESALKSLEKIIPELERRIGDSVVKPVFGIPLEEHLRVTKRKIAFPLELCISLLNELGMSEEGLFRTSGGVSKIKRLKLSIDSGCFQPPLLPEYRDVHVIAGTLKSYLRELPEPLLTFALFNDWMSLTKYPEEQRLMVVQEILKKLPQANKDNLSYLIHFYSRLSKHPENKMSSSNIAICVAPNLLWQKQGASDIMGMCSVLNMLVELFINNVDVLFTSDIIYYSSICIADYDLKEEKDEFTRPVLNNVKLVNHDLDGESYHLESASPRPQIRSKKRAPAPVPPINIKHDIDIKDKNTTNNSYPSGSSTLSRSHKIRTAEGPKTKTSVGINTDESIIASMRRKSLVEADNGMPTKNTEVKPVLVNIDDTKTADMYVVSQPAANIQISKAKPVQQIIAQNIIVEKPPQCQPANTSNTSTETVAKPVAAPRSINFDTEKSTFRLENPMTKSLNAMEIESEGVQIRVKESGDKPSKPVVPIRPASLRALPRGSIDDPLLQKTQCSVYNVAHKQQPSIVNIHNRTEKFQAGHDIQIAEKEKFLGHQPEQRVPAPRLSLENKFNDINSNCDSTNEKTPKPGLSSKPPITKSTEKLNVDEKLNGNSKSSHNRTRSDGNIMDLSDISPFPHTSMQTPPSPRALNKPTQPPPPPPVAVNRKSEPDSTDL